MKSVVILIDFFVLQVINSAAKTFYMSAGQVEYTSRNTVLD